MKFWKYNNEDDLDREIAKTYFDLVEAIKDNDEPLLLRSVSVELFQKYKQEPKAFEL